MEALEQIYAHPTHENERKAVEILAAVFGGGDVSIFGFISSARFLLTQLANSG